MNRVAPLNQKPADVADAQAMLDLSYEALPPTAQLATLWRELETRADGSFFTSWSWIGCWLTVVPPSVDLRLLTVRDAGRVIALGIFAHNTVRRHGVLSSRAAFLHETGVAAVDDLTIEYNGLLVATGRNDALLAACSFITSLSQVDEIFISGIEAGRAPTQTPHGMQRIVKVSSRSHFIALDEVRALGTTYLPYITALPKNKKFRYQIKQRSALVGKLGELSVHAAESVAQAREYLSELKRLHQTHWNAKGLPGAFASVPFEQFHLQLIEREFASGEIQLLKVSAGTTPLAYFYNFVKQGHLYHYQSGLNYAAVDAKASPGLVAHCAAIEHAFAQGVRIYDFMAGDAQYKRTLSNRETEMLWLVLQRDRLKFRLERWARALKRHVKSDA